MIPDCEEVLLSPDGDPAKTGYITNAHTLGGVLRGKSSDDRAEAKKLVIARSMSDIPAFDPRRIK